MSWMVPSSALSMTSNLWDHHHEADDAMRCVPEGLQQLRLRDLRGTAGIQQGRKAKLGAEGPSVEGARQVGSCQLLQGVDA